MNKIENLIIFNYLNSLFNILKNELNIILILNIILQPFINSIIFSFH